MPETASVEKKVRTVRPDHPRAANRVRFRLSVEIRNPAAAGFRWSIRDAAHDETTYRGSVPAAVDIERNQADAIRSTAQHSESVSYAAAENAILGSHGFCASAENGGNGDNGTAPSSRLLSTTVMLGGFPARGAECPDRISGAVLHTWLQ